MWGTPPQLGLYFRQGGGRWSAALSVFFIRKDGELEREGEKRTGIAPKESLPSTGQGHSEPSPYAEREACLLS